MKLGVCIPLYKSEPFIKRIIHNLKKIKKEGQITFFLRDDSNQETDLLQKYKNLFKENIFLSKNKNNLGESATTNKLFEEAKGRGVTHVLLLHQDDIYISGWLKEACKFLRSKKCAKEAMLFGKSIYGTESKNKKTKKVKWVEKPKGVDGIKYLGHEWYWSLSGSIFPTETWCKTGGMNSGLKCCADNDIAVKMIEAGGVPFCSNKENIKKEKYNNTSSKIFFTAEPAIGWSYLTARYNHYRTKKETIKNLLKIYKIYFSKQLFMNNKLIVTFSSILILTRTLLYLVFRNNRMLDSRVRTALACQKR